jgi:hypothetical protein
MTQHEFKNYRRNYMELWRFKEDFKDQIKLMKRIKNKSDLLKIVENAIEENKVIVKELKRSTIPSQMITDFFVHEMLTKEIEEIPHIANTVAKWFQSLENTEDWPNIKQVLPILTIMNAVIMDVYTAARMFKVFNVKESEHHPKEPHNIIYYAGNGHTEPMAHFLSMLGFVKTEETHGDRLSCVHMKGIKQPLFIS